MPDKLVGLDEAIGRHVTPGTSVYITGFTHLIGFAAGHEIIRQRIGGLTLMRMTPDLVYDQMVAAGCADRLVFSYLGNPGVGHLPAIRRAIEGGSLRWTEYTHGSFVAGLRGAASGAPFVPVASLGATDLAHHNPLVRFVPDPYAGGEVAVIPPIRPDVAIVHVHRADAEGNAQTWGPRGEIPEAVHAAAAVIVTAEEIVETDVLRRDPNRLTVLGATVDAVAHVPFGAHPSFVQGRYARDNRFYREWDGIARDTGRLAAWLEDEVHALAGRDAYVERHHDRLTELSAVGEGWTDPVNIGENAAIAAVQE
jgi:glutaconate CoA-transferase subunit A